MIPSSPTDTLSPKLTRHDKKVLRKVPLGFDEKTGKFDAIDAWRLGYELLDEDVPGLILTLRGLEHMGYVRSDGHGSYPRFFRTWHRTREGDAALKEKR